MAEGKILLLIIIELRSNLCLIRSIQAKIIEGVLMSIRRETSLCVPPKVGVVLTGCPSTKHKMNHRGFRNNKTETSMVYLIKVGVQNRPTGVITAFLFKHDDFYGMLCRGRCLQWIQPSFMRHFFKCVTFKSCFNNSNNNIILLIYGDPKEL